METFLYHLANSHFPECHPAPLPSSLGFPELLNLQVELPLPPTSGLAQQRAFRTLLQGLAGNYSDGLVSVWLPAIWIITLVLDTESPAMDMGLCEQGNRGYIRRKRPAPAHHGQSHEKPVFSFLPPP